MGEDREEAYEGDELPVPNNNPDILKFNDVTIEEVKRPSPPSIEAKVL